METFIVFRFFKRVRENEKDRFYLVYRSRLLLLCYGTIYIYTVYTKYIYYTCCILVLYHFANPDMLVSNKSYC